MRFSGNAWLKVICVLAIAAVSVPVSAQVFAPLTLVADGDDDAKPAETADVWIGVRCAPLPPLLQAQLDLPAGQGVLVEDVVVDSPAQKAGLKAFDVISTVDGKAIADPQALAGAVARAGDKEVTVEYLRAGRKQTLTVKPEPRPDTVAPQRQDQRSIRQWVERLGEGPAPMNFRFFHPGMILPRGASLAPPLPDDMTVTIEKQGGKPAKITAKQGDKTWEAGEDSLDKLPADARGFAERMLGLGTFEMRMDEPPAPGAAPRAWVERRNLEPPFNRRLDDMAREIEELRQAFQRLEKSNQKSN